MRAELCGHLSSHLLKQKSGDSPKGFSCKHFLYSIFKANLVGVYIPLNIQYSLIDLMIIHLLLLLNWLLFQKGAFQFPWPL